MRPVRLVPSVVLLLIACTPLPPTPAEAREAMTARMESSKTHEITVDEIHSLELTDCAAGAGGGVSCQVAMDVTFHYDGERERSNDTQRMHFVREGKAWRATPATKP